MGKDRKVSWDMTEEMYDKVMKIASQTKIYKFGPTMTYILREYFNSLEKENVWEKSIIGRYQ